MPFDTSEFRIPLQRMLVALILILVPITIFGLYVTLEASHQVQQMNGEYFRTITRAAADATAQYLGERVSEVIQIANEPMLQQAVMAASSRYENVPEAEIRARVEKIEAKWNSAESDPLLQSILGSEVGRSIRRHRELNPKLLTITVLDRTGATVAATDKPLHYLQTESEYWRTLASNGQAKVYISEVRTDNQTPYISISTPVFQEGSGRLVGSVTALVDLSSLFGHLNQQQIGRTGRVFLINSDEGFVISGAGINPAQRVRSEEFIAIHDALGSLHGRAAGYLHVEFRDRQNYLVGFADTGLKATYPNLPWLIIASQDLREAEGAMRNTAIFALLMTIVGLVILSVLGAYMYLHRRQRIQDIEEAEPEEEIKEEEIEKRRKMTA